MDTALIVVSTLTGLGFILLGWSLSRVASHIEDKLIGHARSVHELAEATKDLMAAQESSTLRASTIESAVDRNDRNIHLTVDRVRTLEHDRTKLITAERDDQIRVDRLEDRITDLQKTVARMEKSAGLVSERVSTIEAERAKLLQQVGGLATKNRPDMPQGPKSELALSDALRTLDPPTG